MLQFLVVCFLVLISTSCHNNSSSQDQQYSTKYYEDGMAKPVIALAPVIDTTSCEVPWSLSEEFSSLITDRVSNKGTLYLSASEPDFLPSSENPFGSDISWVKKEFSPSEFVVFLELVEHDAVRVKKTNDPAENACNLNIGVRIRIIDVRGSEPRVVLQELIRESHYVTRSLIPFDYNQSPWGTDEYATSPMGIAHAAVVKAIAERINDYVLLAKSRWHG